MPLTLRGKLAWQQRIAITTLDARVMSRSPGCGKWLRTLVVVQGALAHRVLGLLWELTFAPGAPAEVAQSPVLSDSLHHYAGMGTEGIDMVWDYITRCISQVGMFELCLTCKAGMGSQGSGMVWGFHHVLHQPGGPGNGT